MARHAAPEPDDEEDEEPFGEASDEDERPARRRPLREEARRGRGGVNEWDPSAEKPVGETRGWLGRPRRPVYWRARDTLWFEPLVALAIVVLLIVGLYAYAQNWPPIYVVESDSMQHGTNDQVGLINTGDLVLARATPSADVVTYVVGMQEGYTTYGEYGDVLLYRPNGNFGATPVIHRAIVFLEYDGAGTWSVPSLAGLPCSASSHPAYRVSSTPTGCGTTGLTGTLTLYSIGWQSARVSIPLGDMGSASGYVTMGDNNFQPGSPAIGEPDQTYAISTLVQSGWILGVARGMIPWFGALKLLLEGQTQMVPTQSWEGMAITLLAVVLGAYGLHLALERHRAGREDDDGDDDPKGGPPDPEDASSERLDASSTLEADEPPTRSRVAKHAPIPKHRLLRAAHRHASGGRPRPRIRRPARSERPKDEKGRSSKVLPQDSDD